MDALFADYTASPTLAPAPTANHTNATAPSPTALGFGKNFPSSDLSYFTIQFILIIFVSKCLAWLLAKIKQPTVIAEVLTGIIIGPSIMGRIPHFTAKIFPSANLYVLFAFADVGIVLFMNLVGLELDFSIMQTQWKRTFIVSAVGIALPMAVSVGSSYAVWNSIDKLYPAAAGVNKSFGTFVVFMAVAMSITAFPVLARIVKEKGLLHARIGQTVLSVAAWDDVTAWILLALSVSLVNGTSKLAPLWTFLLLVGYTLVMFFPVRWGLRKFLITKDGHREITPILLSAYLGFLYVSAELTEYFGLHSIFGAFIFGLVMPREMNWTRAIAEKFEAFTMTFFVPLYFTASGLKTQLGLLNNGNVWGLMLLITSIAITTKIAGGTFSAKFTGLSWRESFTLGVLMNTKGLVELIVLNIGLNAQLISPTTFTMMVVMAICTTMLSSPIVHFLYPFHRIIEFENQTPGKSVFLMALKNKMAVQPLLGILSLIAKPRPSKYKLAVVRTGVSPDMPASYMSGTIVDDVLQYINETSNILGVKVKTTAVFSAEDQESERVTKLVTLCKAKNVDFFFSYWKPDMSEDEMGQATISSSALGREMVGDAIYQKVIQHSGFRSNACVLLDRGLSSSDHHIVFIYTGSMHDAQAIKMIRAMLHNPAASVEVLVPLEKNSRHPDAPDNQTVLQQNALLDSLFIKERAGTVSLQIIHHEDINAAIIGHLAHTTEAKLVVVGSDAYWHLATNEGIIHHDIVSGTHQSFLFVTARDSAHERNSLEEGSTTHGTDSSHNAVNETPLQELHDDGSGSSSS